MGPRPILLVTLLTIPFPILLAQADTLAAHFAWGITQEELRSHLLVLASDAYQGRDTGKEGQKMAAQYLRQEFIRMGIPGVPESEDREILDGYFQQYELIAEKAGEMAVNTTRSEHRLFDGIIYFNEELKESLRVNEVVFLGEAKATLKDKVVHGQDVVVDGAALGEGEPAMLLLRTRIEAVRKQEPRTIWVTMPDLTSWREMVHAGGTRMRLASETQGLRVGSRGAQLVMVEDRVLNEGLKRTSVARIRSRRAGKRWACDLGLVVQTSEERVLAENVLAYIEGSDKKEEVVVLTAHYDHIGVENGVVYNGADDDGSGTVALLEIAEAFAQAKATGHGPRRSILVMPVSGEEKGLLGSRHYSENPVFPLAQTVADLNIDMIGRVDSAHSTSAPYVYIIGSDRLSTQLHAANEDANKQVGLMLDYTFNDENDPNRFYYRSDHYNFARKGVPSIFYFSGVHEDYHQPGDDVEKIQFDLLQQRARLVFHTAWNIANREERLVVDRPIK
ncbi:MAG: M28 family peptidase [Flavobacteriales bacterium]|nr:M28 family peptidase [Flavobacteriales bacterium]